MLAEITILKLCTAVFQSGTISLGLGPMAQFGKYPIYLTKSSLRDAIEWLLLKMRFSQ